MTSRRARWRLKSPTSRLFVQQSVFRRRSKKTSKLRIPGLCEGNSPVVTIVRQKMHMDWQPLTLLTYKNWTFCVSISNAYDYVRKMIIYHITKCVTISHVDKQDRKSKKPGKLHQENMPFSNILSTGGKGQFGTISSIIHSSIIHLLLPSFTYIKQRTWLFIHALTSSAVSLNRRWSQAYMSNCNPYINLDLFTYSWPNLKWHTDGLVQDRSNWIINTLGLLQSCTKPSIY